MSKLKLFISAYACEPGHGSEIGVGWHWVLEMSNYFELWVLTRKSNQLTIEHWIKMNPKYQDIHFLYYDLPRWARWWKKGLRGVRLYYNIWQICTNGIVKKTMTKNNIRVFHHLTYGNVLWKVSSYGQKKFFIWGPVGGVETIPQEYTHHYTKKVQIIESFRRMIVMHLEWNKGFLKRCRNANLILCKTEILRQHIPNKYSHKTVLFTDVAVDSSIQPLNTENTKKDERVEYLSVGRLDSWRGFDLCIEAFAIAVKEFPNIHLTILGNGMDKERLITLIHHLKLENWVTLKGSVPIEKYKEYMNNCDVVLNASLKEGAVTVSFDSMAAGKPLICIETTGYTHYFSKEYAEIIERKGREETIQNLANSITKLTDYHLRHEMGDKAHKAGKSFSWEQRGKDIYETITKALEINNE